MCLAQRLARELAREYEPHRAAQGEHAGRQRQALREQQLRGRVFRKDEQEGGLARTQARHRDGQRAYDADEVRSRVMDLARVRPGYEALSIGYDGEAFTYTPVEPD